MSNKETARECNQRLKVPSSPAVEGAKIIHRNGGTHVSYDDLRHADRITVEGL